MTYTSLAYALFVAATTLIYFLPAVRKHQWVVLLAASTFFYVYNSRWLALFILSTAAVIYSAALYVHRRGPGRSVTAVGATLFLVFGLLFSLKYFDLFHLGLIPLGISFYTFQATGYLIDVYRGTAEPERNFAKFLLFMSFFPQIVQGPISEFGQLQHQLTGEHRPEWMRFKLGCELILWGLFKKLVIADRAVMIINVVTGDYTSYSGTMILFTAVLYAFQLYADFSGGIDISRGIAQMLGIDLAVNFRRPYFSRSLNEYWRRWHITLGAWMKKYVFYSLAMSQTFKNIGKKIRKSSFGKTEGGRHLARTLAPAIASFVVFLFVGIWHGSNLKYIGFGVWNGLVIMLSTLLEPTFNKWNQNLHIRTGSPLWHLWQMLRTFVLVLIGYYFDIAPGLRGAFDMMKRSVTDWRVHAFISELSIDGVTTLDYLILLIMFFVVLFMSVRMERADVDSPGELISRHGKVFQWVMIYGLILLILVLGIYGPGYDPADFVYMQF